MIESARRKQTKKRNSDRSDVDPDTVDCHGDSSPEELLAIDYVLDRFAAEDADAATLVKLRVFSGFSIEKAALAKTRSTSTRGATFTHWGSCCMNSLQGRRPLNGSGYGKPRWMKSCA